MTLHRQAFTALGGCQKSLKFTHTSSDPEYESVRLPTVCLPAHDGSSFDRCPTPERSHTQQCYTPFTNRPLLCRAGVFCVCCRAVCYRGHGAAQRCPSEADRCRLARTHETQGRPRAALLRDAARHQGNLLYGIMVGGGSAMRRKYCSRISSSCSLLVLEKSPQTSCCLTPMLRRSTIARRERGSTAFCR